MTQLMERCFVESLMRLCGGGILSYSSFQRHPQEHPNLAPTEKNPEWFQELTQMVQKSISYLHGRTHSTTSEVGIEYWKSSPQTRNGTDSTSKPHDIEIRIALSLFHKYKTMAPSNSSMSPNPIHCTFRSSSRKRTVPDFFSCSSSKTTIREEDMNSEGTTAEIDNNRSYCLHIISDLGLVRTIHSPLELAERLIEDITLLEQTTLLGYDIRSNRSGILCIVTPERSHILRTQMGKLPCSFCTQWCKGDKGLWWHEQQEHGNEQAKIRSLPMKSTNETSLILYVEGTIDNIDRAQNGLSTAVTTTLTTTHNRNDTYNPTTHGTSIRRKEHVVEDYFTCIRERSLDDFITLCHNPPIHLSTLTDKHGATPLHWAAGCGKLDFVIHLITHGHCDANQPQGGKRSYQGRTPLHWAARNGHLHVVQYLIEQCHVQIDAQTADGTTAFCWASWQGHLQIMKYLLDKKCDFTRVNSYHCNAALWVAQSTCQDTTVHLECLQWLDSIGCDVQMINMNGHGVLHKAAQRGRKNICQWFTSTFLSTNAMQSVSASKDTDKDNHSSKDPIHFISPDMEHFCPSDLAGMEGHEDLALLLSKVECDFALTYYHDHCHDKDETSYKALPAWLSDGITDAKSIANRIGISHLWESRGGIRRMSSHIVTAIESVCKLHNNSHPIRSED